MNKPYNKVMSKEFKEGLIEFVNDCMGACSSHVEEIEDCETYLSLKNYLISNNDIISNFIGHTCDSDGDRLEEHIEELENECKSLLYQINKLEKKYECFTYWEELNLELFNKYKDRYTPWELEKLLENGKK